PVSDHPTGAAGLDLRVHQTVAGEAAPSLKIGAHAWLAADHGDEIARTRATQRIDQLRKETGGKRPCPGVELEVGLHWHGEHYSPISHETAGTRRSTKKSRWPSERRRSLSYVLVDSAPQRRGAVLQSACLVFGHFRPEHLYDTRSAHHT